MYKDTVTLFNRKGTHWIASVLTGVDLNADRSAIIRTQGAESSDVAKLHIKSRGNKVGNYTYLLPKEYEALAQVTNEITLRSGNDFDFIYVGGWANRTVNDNDYTDGFYDYMRSHYDEVYAISSVAKYSVIDHFEVMLK